MTADIRERLATSVADVGAPADILTRARQGGARRLRRRTLTVTLVLAIALPAGIIVAANHHLAAPKPAEDSGIPDPYGRFLPGPTRGDLANDRAYLRAAIAAWDSSHATSTNKRRGVFDDLRGEPKVYWAGRTPGGRAAIVVQHAYLRRLDGFNPPGKGEGLSTVIGFIGEDPGGGARVVADWYPSPASHPMGFVTSKDRSFWDNRFPTRGESALIVLDIGRPLGYALGRDFTADGSTVHRWLPLDLNDGVAVAGLPDGRPGGDVAVTELPAASSEDPSVQVIHSPHTYQPELPWPVVMVDDWPLTAKSRPDRAMDLLLAASIRQWHVPTETPRRQGDWRIYGDTPNGSRVVFGLVSAGSRVRLHGVMKGPGGRVHRLPGGTVELSAALPVMVRLPDRQGWAVARPGGRPEYRVPGKDWVRGTSHAALVPDVPGVEVRVRGVDTTLVVPLR